MTFYPMSKKFYPMRMPVVKPIASMTDQLTFTALGEDILTMIIDFVSSRLPASTEHPHFRDRLKGLTIV